MVTADNYSEVGDLTVVVGAWDSSSNPNVHARRVDWPELRLLAGQYRSMFQRAEGIESLLEMARTAFRAMRMLTCSPTAPDAEAAGLSELVERCAAFAESHPEHSVVGNVGALRYAAQAVMAKPSPVQEMVVGAVSEFGTEAEKPWMGQPEAVLVVPPDLVSGTESFLADEELEAHVRTPEQAKQHRYRGAIICGDLRTAYRSFWTSPETAARTYGWLVTAPPADKTVLIETPVSTNRVDDLWLLGPEAHPPLAVKLTAISGEVVVEPQPLPPPLPVRPVKFVLPAFNENLRPATLVRLASKRSVFFASGLGPQPRLVLVEEGEAETKDRVRITQLVVGDYLVIRASGSDYEEVKGRAERDLMENKEWSRGDIDRARGLVGDLKRHLRSALKTKGERSLREAMVRSGLTESHARMLCRNPLEEQYIAPGPRGFAPLVRAIGAPELVGQEQWFRDLRTAHRQAGFGITTDLNRRLSEDLAWFDELSIRSFAIVDDEHLGTLLIETVAYPAEKGYDVPVTYLGRVAGGHPLRPIAAETLRAMR